MINSPKWKRTEGTRSLPLPVLTLRHASTNLVRGCICLLLLSLGSFAQTQSQQSTETKRQRYQIQLKLDFDALSYAGSERVLWFNHGEHAAAVLYFHLYSNLRADQGATASSAGAQVAVSDEPRIEITEVRSAAEATPLTYAIEDQGTTLRVNLREQVAPGNSTEVVVGFKGVVPEVDPDETGLTAHVVKQVSAALRGDREMRRPRDLNFRCRSVMLLALRIPYSRSTTATNGRANSSPTSALSFSMKSRTMK